MKKALLTVAIAAIIGAVPVMSSFAEDATSTTTTTAPTTTTTVVPTTTTAPVVTTTTAPKPLTEAQVRFLRIQRVNHLTYNHGDYKPALEAFRLVATNRGWTPAQIKSWETAVINIMMGESGFCPNVLRGAVIANPKGCVLKKQGKHQDAGFGQLIRINYKHTSPGTGWLCAQEHLCSKWDIIASPYNSMTALVALIERSGTHPWCYNRWARRYHRPACTHPGMDVG